MSYPLIIRPEAEADLTEEFDWYEDRKNGLGREFLTEVRAVFTQGYQAGTLFNERPGTASS